MNVDDNNGHVFQSWQRMYNVFEGPCLYVCVSGSGWLVQEVVDWFTRQKSAAKQLSVWVYVEKCVPDSCEGWEGFILLQWMGMNGGDVSKCKDFYTNTDIFSVL